MSGELTLARVEIAPFRPALAGDGFAVSYGRITALDHRVLRLTLSDGRQGTGEVVRSPAWNAREAEALEDRLLPMLAGANLADLPGLAKRMRSDGMLARGLAFAIETAFYDLAGQRSGLPASALLGGRAAADVPALLGLSCDAPHEMVDALTARQADHPNVQIKLGTGTLDQDFARIDAVLGALGPQQMLYADFNGALSRVDASALSQFTHPQLIWEEPCLALDDNLALIRELPRPVLLDQCITDLNGYRRALADGGAHGVSIKPALLGGLSVARAACDLAIDAGMMFRLDGPWCGPVASAAILHLAVTAAPELLLFSADLTDPLAVGGRAMKHPVPGRAAPPDGSGLGLDAPTDLIWQEFR